ncbi:MAG: hypothetical protein PHY45_18035 [Rhodocyclaceae bacterium]|nr:hypothetical protein [Rhodocyclaceae bacterium]
MPFAQNHKPAPPARSECCRGAVIGAANGLILAAIGGLTLPVQLLAAVGAGGVGALIALLLWSASGSLAEDPVPPPREDR